MLIGTIIVQSQPSPFVIIAVRTTPSRCINGATVYRKYCSPPADCSLQSNTTLSGLYIAILTYGVRMTPGPPSRPQMDGFHHFLQGHLPPEPNHTHPAGTSTSLDAQSTTQATFRGMCCAEPSSHAFCTTRAATAFQGQPNSFNGNQRHVRASWNATCSTSVMDR